MEGLVFLRGNKYLFRDDDASLFSGEIRAWDIYPKSHRGSAEKWDGFPKGSIIETFNLDNPPRTVSFLPALNNY